MSRFAACCFLAFAVAVMPCMDSDSEAAMIVGTKLSLVIDTSGSISANEFTLQMTGYKNAFKDAGVQAAILSQTNGIAVNTIFFSTTAKEMIAFTQLDTLAKIDSFADSLGALVRHESLNTNIAGGMLLSRSKLNDNTVFSSTRLIMDVSGDGEQNVGAGLTAAQRHNLVNAQRDAAASDGIKVNGLAIGGPTITNYYNARVRTTDGFVIAAADFAAFDTAIKQKIVSEITGNPPVPEPATLALWSLGLMGMTYARRRRRS